MEKKVYKLNNPSSDFEYVISDLDFAIKDFCKAYDRNGQQYGCEVVGCYSADNWYARDSFVFHNQDLLLEAMFEKFNTLYDNLKDYENEDADLYNSVVIEQFKINEEEAHIQAPYENFWNGHKWSSILLETYSDYFADIEYVDEQFECEILSDLETAELKYDDGRGKLYQGKKYDFLQSFFEDAWELYSVREIEA